MRLESFIKYFLIVLYLAGVIFHALVIGQIIPLGYAWGGRLHTLEEMYLFETLSLMIMTLVMALFAINLGYLSHNTTIKKIAKNAMWILFILFPLNTLGKIRAKTRLEMLIATPLTGALAGISFYFIQKKYD